MEGTFIVGSTEAPSKVFLLFFLLSYWLKFDHLKCQIEHGFYIFASYSLLRNRNNRNIKLHDKSWL